MSEATFPPLEKLPGPLVKFLPTTFACLPVMLTTHLINFFASFFSEFCILGEVSVMTGNYYLVLVLAFLVLQGITFAANFWFLRGVEPKSLIFNYFLGLVLFAGWNMGISQEEYVDYLSACMFD